MLEPRFVESVPENIDDGVLYISIEFRTTIHACCCGCGNAVVLPLRPTAWRFTYDGTAISMAPSVGNWSFLCRSHYWINGGHIVWAPAWSDERVARGRAATLVERGADIEAASCAAKEPELVEQPGRWRRLVRFVRQLA